MKKLIAAAVAGAFAVTAFAADAPKKDEKKADAKTAAPAAKKEEKKAEAKK